MSKILAQGMITLTQLYEGVQVILTPTAVLIPCDSEENPKSNAYINASTNVKAFLGTMDITSGITLGELEYSDSTVKASKTGTKVSITAITTRTGYVDIPVSATINGETIDLGKHRFSFVKQIDGQTGQPGAPGFSYTLNIKGGTRGVAYAANGTNPEPKTSSQFSVELLKNGVKVANPASISWTCGGNLSGSSSAATFTPTIKSTYTSGSSYVKVSVKEFAASLAVEETIPIICTKHADGLDWINEWNNQYVQVGTEKIITPKIFAGTKSSANELTGVAIGRDVLGGNANKVIGIVGYKKNIPVFSLDQDANFFVSSSGSAGDIKNGTNNAKGIYFDGNNLYVSGKVRISGGSTIGENNTLVEEVINNSNLGAQANDKLDNLSIGGRNILIRKEEIKNSMISPDGTVGTLSGSSLMKDFISVIADEELMFSQIPKDGGDNYFRYCFYAEDKTTVIRRRPNNSLKFKEIVPTGAKWLRVSYDSNNQVKIERGNKATDWTPAPEDVQADIDKKANSSDVYKKTETYTKTQTDSAIEVAKNEINLGISSTYETKTNVETKVNNAINNIQVGGRNLFAHSLISTQLLKTNPYTITSSSYYVETGTKIKLEPSTKYTFSYKHRVLKGNTSNLRIGLGLGNGANYVQDLLPWGNCNLTTGVFTFTTPSSLTTSNQYFAIRPVLNYANDKTEYSVELSNIKLEKGTKATDWTPAVEDTESAINKKANSADVYTKSETYTKTETDSKIKVAKDEINLGVSNTYETKTNVETKVNNAVNNIEVGGRNLLTNCAKYTSSSPLNTQSALKDGYHLHQSICTPIELEVGTYVIQAETNGTWSSTHNTNGVDSSKKYCALWLVSRTNGNNINLFIDMTRSVCTVNITTKGTYFLRTNTYSDGTTNVSVNFWNIKLEKGNKKTGYSPAIEDTQSQIDNVTQRISSAEQKITPDAIVSTVTNSATYKNNLNSKVDTSTYNSKIEQLNNSITSKVSMTEVNNAINNIQIGGRNLYTGTKDFTGNKWIQLNGWGKQNEKYNNLTVYKREGKWYGIWQNISVKAGEKYTLSAYIKTDGEVHLYADIIQEDGTKLNNCINNQGKLVTKSNEWTRVSATFKCNGSGTLQARFENSIDGKTTWICGLKLEKGDKATDYSEAPEDTQTQIDGAINSINSVTQRITTAESSITQLNNSITSKVSMTEVNNAINNIEIGGRNLVAGTSNEYNSGYTNFSGATNTCISLGNAKTEGLKVGDTISGFIELSYENIVPADGQTIKIWTQGAGNVTSWNNGTFPGSDRATISGTGTIRLKWVSAKLDANHIKNAYWLTQLRCDYIKSGKIKWRLYKVERGTKHTSWTPAPEDAQTQIDNVVSRVSSAEQKITPTAIVNSVSSGINNGTALNVTSTTLDKNGLTIKNGALTIKDSAGNVALNGDTNGNLTLRKSIIVGGSANGSVSVRNSSNSEIVKINNAGIKINSANALDITHFKNEYYTIRTAITQDGLVTFKGNPNDGSVLSANDTTIVAPAKLNIGTTYHRGNIWCTGSEGEGDCNGLTMDYHQYRSSNPQSRLELGRGLTYSSTDDLTGQTGSLKQRFKITNDGQGILNGKNILASNLEPVTAETGSTACPSGFGIRRVYNNGYPTSYGNAITLNGAGGCNEFLMGWSGASGGHASLYYRNKRDVSGANWSDWAEVYSTLNKPSPNAIGALPTSGGTMTGAITSSLTTSTHIDGNKGRAIINSTANGSGYTMLAKMNSSNGKWTMGSWGTTFNLFYTSNTNVNNNTNTYDKRLWMEENGNVHFPTGIYTGGLNTEDIKINSWKNTIKDSFNVNGGNEGNKWLQVLRVGANNKIACGWLDLSPNSTNTCYMPSGTFTGFVGRPVIAQVCPDNDYNNWAGAGTVSIVSYNTTQVRFVNFDRNKKAKVYFWIFGY